MQWCEKARRQSSYYRRHTKFAKVMFSRMFVCPQGVGGPVQGGSLFRGFLSRGSLPRGVSVQGGLCPGGSLSRGSLSMGGLCPWGVSVVRSRAGGTHPTGMHSSCYRRNCCIWEKIHGGLNNCKDTMTGQTMHLNWVFHKFQCWHKRHWHNFQKQKLSGLSV